MSRSADFYYIKRQWLFGVSMFFLVVSTGSLWAQKSQPHQVLATKIGSTIVPDGMLDEAIWQQASRIGDFYLNYPHDTAYANTQTEVMIAYDDQNLYLAFICYDPAPEKKFVAQSLRRDFDGGRTDFVTVYLDTYNDGQNGFSFGITPYGVQREAIITDGDNLLSDWDNKWYSGAKIYEDRWEAEMVIPFKSVRYKKNAKAWRVNFARIDQKTNEVSSWVPVPRNFGVQALAFTGELTWEYPLGVSTANVAVIPFVTSRMNQNVQEGEAAQYGFGAGADAKIALTPALNLDLTFNPDFSQVEVDQQVTNLDRFEIFFPERRQFFLENNDLFARFGFSRIRPFFSRRIGIARDTTTGLTVENPIFYGARLSGKLSSSLRVGAMNMQTGKNAGAGIEGQNYTVLAFQQKVFARSNIGVIFVNRQATSDSISEFRWQNNDFNRVIGIDYNLASADNRWRGKFFYHQALTPERLANQYAHASYVTYNDRHWNIAWNHEYVGENYRADVGFIPRGNHWRLEPWVGYLFYPKNSQVDRPLSINNHGPYLYTSTFWNTTGLLTDQVTELSYRVNFNNTASFSAGVSQQYIRLLADFDPSNSGGARLVAGSDYAFQRASVSYNSNNRAVFLWNASYSWGGFYNGELYSGSLGATYQIRPLGSVSLGFNYNRLALPEPYNSTELLLISPRVDFTFTRALFLAVFCQYNNQIDNINLNARLQWRFKPVSDLFLVYTENYFPETFDSKTRALVLKLTYWLSI
jgi:hypothetical protein